MHLFGGVYTAIQPDGELEFSIGSIEGPIFEIDARNLTAGVEMTMVATTIPLEISYAAPLPTVAMLPTPLPPAIWMLLSAIAITWGFGRNKNHRAY
jgi:hypothetical protein